MLLNSVLSDFAVIQFSSFCRQKPCHIWLGLQKTQLNATAFLAVRFKANANLIGYTFTSKCEHIARQWQIPALFWRVVKQKEGKKGLNVFQIQSGGDICWILPVVDLWGARGKADKGPSDYVIILSQPWYDLLIKPWKGICGSRCYGLPYVALGVIVRGWGRASFSAKVSNIGLVLVFRQYWLEIFVELYGV